MENFSISNFSREVSHVLGFPDFSNVCDVTILITLAVMKSDWSRNTIPDQECNQLLQGHRLLSKPTGLSFLELSYSFLTVSLNLEPAVKNFKVKISNENWIFLWYTVYFQLKETLISFEPSTFVFWTVHQIQVVEDRPLSLN